MAAHLAFSITFDSSSGSPNFCRVTSLSQAPTAGAAEVASAVVGQTRYCSITGQFSASCFVTALGLEVFAGPSKTGREYWLGIHLICKKSTIHPTGRDP